MLQYVRLMRPHHWIKNAFVLVPVPFSLAEGAVLNPTLFLVGFFGYCLVNSAVYAINDVQDREADRLNPKKRARPIASGAISPGAALALAAVLLAAGLSGCFYGGGWTTLFIAALYLVINLGYANCGTHRDERRENRNLVPLP